MREDLNIATVFESVRESLARAVQHIVPAKEIEDIVQETYVRFCRAQGRRKIRSPRSFMFRTARNLALDYVKRAESRLAESFDESDEATLPRVAAASDSTMDRVSSEEEFSLFCDSVKELPEKCRRAFILRKVYGYTQKEIASMMTISEKTVEKHISLGIKRCTEYLVQHDFRPADRDRASPVRLVASSGGRKLK